MLGIYMDDPWAKWGKRFRFPLRWLLPRSRSKFNESAPPAWWYSQCEWCLWWQDLVYRIPYTPVQTNDKSKEPEYHSMKKENHLKQTFICWFHVSFQGSTWLETPQCVDLFAIGKRMEYRTVTVGFMKMKLGAGLDPNTILHTGLKSYFVFHSQTTCNI